MLPGAGAMAEQLRVLAGLAKKRGYFPAPTSPVSPAHEDLWPLTQRHVHTRAHTP